jgi:coenzyme PQQ precursor peptide PqqA
MVERAITADQIPSWEPPTVEVIDTGFEVTMYLYTE